MSLEGAFYRVRALSTLVMLTLRLRKTVTKWIDLLVRFVQNPLGENVI